jgi:peptide/nickel transport system substrate-binding protein
VSYYYSVGQRQQDIEKARELMAEAGYADGFEIRAIINLGSVDLATAVQACLAQIGITMNVESYDLGTQIPMWIAGETDITVDSGGESNATGDPFASTSFYYEGSTLTAARINDPDFNEYFYEGLYSVDPDVRAEAYQKMQEWNYENCRIIPICESTRCTAWNSAKISSVYFTNPGRPVVTYIHFA